jgi:hypothetical protein
MSDGERAVKVCPNLMLAALAATTWVLSLAAAAEITDEDGHEYELSVD